MRSYAKKLVIFATIILALITLYYSGILNYTSLQNIQQHAQQLQSWVQVHYVLSIVLYIALYAFYVGLSLPAPSVLTVSSGFLYGAVLGTLYTNIGGTIGAIGSFMMFRYLFGNAVRVKYADKLASFNKSFAQYGAWYLLSIRCIAVVPFFIANALASMTPVRLSTFIWTTSLGIIPVSFLYALAGKQLHTLNLVTDIFSIKMLAILFLLACFALVPVLVMKYMKQKV